MCIEKEVLVIVTSNLTFTRHVTYFRFMDPARTVVSAGCYLS